MDDSKYQRLKSKSIELLNLFYTQNEYKYKFGPEMLNDLLVSKDKLHSFSPKSCKHFKKIVKLKSNKIMKNRNNSKPTDCDLKNVKKIQDEQNVNDALQEATVLEKIGLLKKKGIWSREALPKVMEPARTKVHWDYLIEEAEWLSTDMKNRFSWKILAAKIIAESAKSYVFIKDEIKMLEYIQVQEEARLVCSRIANMVKEWWRKKTDCNTIKSEISKQRSNFSNSTMDLSQLWLTKSLINAEIDNENSDPLFDRSDSDSVCSFDSSHSYCSIMLTDEDNLVINEISYDFSDSCSSSENLIGELSWLENNIEFNEIEGNYSFENEITELKILSQMPLEKIIDENYFLNSDNIDLRSGNSSDVVDSDSLVSEALSQDNNDLYLKTTSKTSFIVTQSEKIQSILATSFSEPLSISNNEILDALLKNECINRNIHCLFELVRQKLSFAIVSSLQCGDDRLMISVLLGYLSNKFNSHTPELIITSSSQISEWYTFLKAICPNCKIVVLDLYLSYKSAHEILEQIESSFMTICIISYSAIFYQFCLTSVKWNNIIYDQIEKFSESLSGIPDHIIFSDVDLLGIRIGLISNDSNTLIDSHFAQSVFLLFYSNFEVDELLNEIQCHASKRISKKSDLLNSVFFNHCFPLKKLWESEKMFQVVMCELTPFQNILHQSVVDKLKKSLESNNLLDIVEAICADIQLSQHPFFFDCNFDNQMTELLHSFRQKCSGDHLMPIYYLPNNDRLSFYLPRKISTSLSYVIDNKWEKFSSHILPYNLCDLTVLGFSKYERQQLKTLLISTNNADYSLNKISTCLSDIDDDSNSCVNINEIPNGNHLEPSNEFLSQTDLENLKFELKNLPGKGFQQFLNEFSVSECEYQSENCEKDLQMSATLAARRSKTKFKTRLTNISKENEKYMIFLDSSDCYYFTPSNILLMDLNLCPNKSDCLTKLCLISKNFIDSNCLRYKIIESKVMARSPKLVTTSKPKNLIKTNENYLIKSISDFFKTYFAQLPRINAKLSTTSMKDIKLSGKLKTLNSMLKSLANDSLVKSCIIISHSLELLDMIETLIFINNNYGIFLKIRLNSCTGEDEEYLLNLIDKFNKFQSRNKKTILLLHSRTNEQILNHINAESCSVIIVDSHWQTDSDQIILKLINRWGMNCILSQKNGISSIYKLCTFETLEQYFLTNDLSFLYENTYSDSNDLILTTSAVVCQQSILKYFVDKLLSPLKEKVISGFCIDDFQTSLQKKSNLRKVPAELIIDLFTSFESPYDLLQMCNYQSFKKMQTFEFERGNFKDGIEVDQMTDKKNQLVYNEHFINSSINCKESYRNWEIYRIRRQNKLKYLMDITEDQNQILFYDQKQFQLDNSMIWMPPQLDESIKVMSSEIVDMYKLKPIRDTELSFNLIPTKSYIVKSNHKKWDEKTSSLNVRDETSIVPTEYNEVERLKKRKLPNEYSVGEYSQYSLNHQKKRKIFTNRRYYTENETNISTAQGNFKSRYKIEKKNVNESELQVMETKDILDVKKSPPVVCEPHLVENNQIYSVTNQPSSQNVNNNAQTSEIGRSNSIVLCTGDSQMKINLQRPFYSKEGLKALKIKRQQITTGHMTSIQTKTNPVTGTIMQNYISQQRPVQNNRTPLFLNNKYGSNSDVTSQSNGENEYEKLPEWNIHEEAVLYQNISHFQDHQFSTSNSEKSNSLPNFKICEHYLNYYAITNTHRSCEMCKIHFTKLQMGFLNQNKCDNNLSRINRGSNLSNPNGVLRVRTVNETRPAIAGVTGRKLKIKMKNSIGTYGTSIFGSTQAMTNKIKMFQCFLNDMKVNLTQTNQIVNSCLNSYDGKTTLTFKMLDEVVNTSKHPSLLPNHSQTIKKNATHISALEEHNIQPDKIFTPAMLIQRREEIDKERESESNHLNSNANRQQIMTSASSTYRNLGYFETNPTNSSSHSLNHIRRTTSANIGNTQNLYSLQTASNSQIVSRARYNVPINRQVVSGATVIHQNTNQIQPSVSAMSSNITNSSNVTNLSQNQSTNLGSRSQAVQFQIQHTRNSSTIPRRNSTQPVIQRLVYPGNFSSIRQNSIMNRGSTAFVRPIIPVNNSNTQSTATSNSIITVFPNSHEQSSNSTINRTIDRNTNFNIGNQIRGHNVRTNIATVSSSSRGNINPIPRMLHVNQINRNNMNINNRNNQDQ